MHVLVTGGAGFIGSALVERLLAEGHEVEVVDDLSTGTLANLADARAEGSGRLRINQAGVLDDGFDALVTKRSPEVVIHLASATAKHARTPAGQAAADVVGTVAVLEASARGGVRKVICTAAARAQQDPIRGIPARAVVEYLDAYDETRGLSSTALVLPTVYGPRQTATTESCVVAVFVARALAGERCVVHGSGTQRRDLLFVDDAVDAYVRALTAGDGETIEVGTGHPVSVEALRAAVAQAAGTTLTATAGERRPGDPDDVVVDPARAEALLGWRSWTSLEDGLARTVAAARDAAGPSDEQSDERSD